jgi:hypothetical protein
MAMAELPNCDKKTNKEKIEQLETSEENWRFVTVLGAYLS